MSYESKTDLEDIDGERYYYLWTSSGYIVYHWDKDLKSLDQISSDFFINIDKARACAHAHVRGESVKLSYKERLVARIARLQQEIQDMED